MDFQPASRGFGPRANAQAQTNTSLFFRDVYAWMAAAVAISGLTAYGVATTPAVLRLLFGNPLLTMALLFAPLGVGIYFQRNALQLSSFAAANLFFVYATLMGAMMSSALLVYTGASVGQAFFSASVCFGSAAVYGTYTRRELSQAQQFLMMGLVGVIVASLVNLFLRSPAVDWMVSMVTVVVFAGMTAWDHQQLKRLHQYQGGQANLALVGAFMLYVNFINLFMAILRLTGQQRRND